MSVELHDPTTCSRSFELARWDEVSTNVRLARKGLCLVVHHAAMGPIQNAYLHH